MQGHLANTQDVMNQFMLQLNCSIWAGMEDDPDCIADMNRIQIKYALDVLTAATSAYTDIQAMLNKRRPKKE